MNQTISKTFSSDEILEITTVKTFIQKHIVNLLGINTKIASDFRDVIICGEYISSIYHYLKDLKFDSVDEIDEIDLIEYELHSMPEIEKGIPDVIALVCIKEFDRYRVEVSKNGVDVSSIVVNTTNGIEYFEIRHKNQQIRLEETIRVYNTYKENITPREMVKRFNIPIHRKPFYSYFENKFNISPLEYSLIKNKTILFNEEQDIEVIKQNEYTVSEFIERGYKRYGE